MALSLVLLTSCATSKPAPEQWLSDKNLVLQSLQDAHVSNAQLKEHIEQMDQKMMSLERLSLEQDTKIAMLEASLAASQEKAKNIAHAQRTKKPKKKKTSLNKRLDAMAVKQAKAKVVKPVTEAAASNEKNAYTAAYLALKSGRYDEASSGFVAVIQAHPKGKYTDQAYYWLGESLIAQRRNKEALESFIVVANQYDKSPKHAAALLKIATVYQNLQQVGDARAALQRVIREYPDSKTAEIARSQLKALSQNNGAKK